MVTFENPQKCDKAIITGELEGENGRILIFNGTRYSCDDYQTTVLLTHAINPQREICLPTEVEIEAIARLTKLHNFSKKAEIGSVALVLEEIHRRDD
jgi:hypothetical protein